MNVDTLTSTLHPNAQGDGGNKRIVIALSTETKASQYRYTLQPSRTVKLKRLTKANIRAAHVATPTTTIARKRTCTTFKIEVFSTGQVAP